MLQTTVQHGPFQLTLAAYAPRAQAHLAYFVERLPPGVFIADLPTMPWHLTLVTAEPLSSQTAPGIAASSEHSIWAMLHRAWADLEPTWQRAVLVELTETTGHQAADFVYLVHQKWTPRQVRVLLGNYVFRLNRRWLMQKGWLLLHASAVAWRDRGFLLLGRSGAGKTTAAKLSQGMADAILHDDKVFVKPGSDGYSLLAAPGLNFPVLKPLEGEDDLELAPQMRQTSLGPDYRVPLRAVFVLKKDEGDHLVPLSGLAAARALVEGFLEMSDGIMAPRQGPERAMHVLSDLARRVPAFELYFRKSPDLWGLIDERFPD